MLSIDASQSTCHCPFCSSSVNLGRYLANLEPTAASSLPSGPTSQALVTIYME